MYEGPEFRHYHSFVTVADECHFGKAAERLHLTQPALTAHIQQLERWVGQRLFKRVHHGAELTEAGRNFLTFARRILHYQANARKAVSRKHSDSAIPLRLGYSPYVNHELIDEAILGYSEIVPEGHLNTSSDSTAQLLRMLEDGQLDAAILTLPISTPNLIEQVVCENRLLLCLRRDDPLAAGVEIPKQVVVERLKIMFSRNYHPMLYDTIVKAFRAAGMNLRFNQSFSAPSEMQYLVSKRGCFGLIREGMPLQPDLVALPIEGVNIGIQSAFVFTPESKTPTLSMLAYRMSRRCRNENGTAKHRKSVTAATHTDTQTRDVKTSRGLKAS